MPNFVNMYRPFLLALMFLSLGATTVRAQVSPKITWRQLATTKFEEVFDSSKGHPPVLKKFLSGNISLETLVIYDKIFLFGNNFDKKLKDPVWETVSRKLKKYSSFLNIDVPRYKNILREIVLRNK